MTSKTKKYYAWQGQNASTGSPNRITGCMSMYGKNLVFRTKQARDEYVDNFRSNNPSEYCVALSKRELREKNLGSSVADFEEYLEYDEQETQELINLHFRLTEG